MIHHLKDMLELDISVKSYTIKSFEWIKDQVDNVLEIYTPSPFIPCNMFSHSFIALAVD